MTRKFAIHALLMMPAALLCGLIALVAVGAWVSAILNDPARFAEAPVIIQKLTRSVYFNTRTHWQTKEECIEFDSHTLYRPRPGTCYFGNAEFSTTMHFDERGRRRTANPPDGGTGTSRIIIVGDSHAMGWGVEDHETFASQLALEHGYRTCNLGVSSYGTARELLSLEQRYELEPDDIIVIQYSDNDLEENEHFLAHGSVGPYQKDQLNDLITYRPTPTAPLPIAGRILRATAYAIASKFRAQLKNLSGSSDKQSTGDHAARTLVGVIQAFPFLRHHRVIVVSINGPANTTHLYAGRQALGTAGLTFIVPPLSRQQFFSIDDHMTKLGHRAVADAIAQAIDTE